MKNTTHLPLKRKWTRPIDKTDLYGLTDTKLSSAPPPFKNLTKYKIVYLTLLFGTTRKYFGSKSL